MKCEISKVKRLRKASSKIRGDPGRCGIQEPRKEDFMMSLFLLNAPENLCKKKTRGKKKKKTSAIVKQQNVGGVLGVEARLECPHASGQVAKRA